MITYCYMKLNLKTYNIPNLILFTYTLTQRRVLNIKRTVFTFFFFINKHLKK